MPALRHDEQLQRHVSGFATAGLNQRQRVMVFTEAMTVTGMASWLRCQDRAFTAALDTEQLQVHRREDVHMSGHIDLYQFHHVQSVKAVEQIW